MRHLLLALFLVSPAIAYADEDTDTAIARQHFAKGSELYEAGLFAEAVKEFEAAHDVKPLPAFDYNIGKCFDRLEQWSRAVEAYERYLASGPTDLSSADVNERLSVLRHRLTESRETAPSALELKASVPLAPRRMHRFVAPAALGGGALVFGAIGAGLLGSAAHSFGELRSSCAPYCPASAGETIQPRAIAGDVMLGITGVALVVDVALWVRAARRR
jgi:tetratricopeptide (TPR) repeat protein